MMTQKCQLVYIPPSRIPTLWCADFAHCTLARSAVRRAEPLGVNRTGTGTGTLARLADRRCKLMQAISAVRLND